MNRFLPMVIWGAVACVFLGAGTQAAGAAPAPAAVSGAAPVSVPLAPVANVYGLVNTGSPVPDGGVDGSGDAYSETLTGTSITWSGATFAVGIAGTPNALSNVTLAVPAGSFSSVELLATGVHGNQANQTFVVTYTDGTSASIVRSLSDWYTPQNYPGESTALTMPYRITASGAEQTKPFNLYGYSLALNSAKTLRSITLPANRNVVIVAVDLAQAPAPSCDPLSYGAVGDGKADNTSAIQNAIDACATQGGGTVSLSLAGGRGVYVTGPLTLKSHVLFEINKGVTLQGTNDHSRYVGAYINWIYQPNEALISANGSTDVGIAGAGTIDGAGNQLQPNGGPSWWTLAPGMPTSTRPWLLEFYQCDGVTITGITLQNSPMWNEAIRFSTHVTESGVTINAVGNSPNTDGVDIVGSSNVTLSNLAISVGDDIIALKSGLPIDPTDPKQVGLPRVATSGVSISNITAGAGHGISIGSEAVNGVNNVSIQNVTYVDTSYGFRIKTARDRGSQIYDISLANLTMTDVALPLLIDAYYPASSGPTEPPYRASQPITSTTPYVHDVTVQNLIATGATLQSLIEGLPESCMHNITLRGVNIQSKAAGIALRHMTGSLIDVVSVPAPPDPPFVVQEDVTVTTGGTTPTIPNTPPQAGQTACAAQVVPVP